MKSVVVLISGSGSNLQALIDRCNDSTINARIKAVISNNPGCAGIKRAQNAGITTYEIDHRKYESRELFDKAVSEKIDSCNPDLVILAGFMRILSAQFVAKYHGKLLNIHPSLLPKYPGLHTHQRAIEAGDKKAGVTVHFVTAELDGGPAIIQAEVPIYTEDTAETLAKRVLIKEHKIYPLAVEWFLNERICLIDGKAVLDNQILPTCGYKWAE